MSSRVPPLPDALKRFPSSLQQIDSEHLKANNPLDRRRQKCDELLRRPKHSTNPAPPKEPLPSRPLDYCRGDQHHHRRVTLSAAKDNGSSYASSQEAIVRPTSDLLPPLPPPFKSTRSHNKPCGPIEYPRRRYSKNTSLPDDSTAAHESSDDGSECDHDSVCSAVKKAINAPPSAPPDANDDDEEEVQVFDDYDDDDDDDEDDDNDDHDDEVNEEDEDDEVDVYDDNDNGSTVIVQNIQMADNPVAAKYDSADDYDDNTTAMDSDEGNTDINDADLDMVAANISAQAGAEAALAADPDVPADVADLPPNTTDTTSDNVADKNNNSNSNSNRTPNMAQFAGMTMADLATGASARDSFDTAKNHWNKMVHSPWLKEQIPKGQHKKYKGVFDTTYNKMDKRKIDWNLLNLFGTYLFNKASIQKHESAGRYLSAFDSHRKSIIQMKGQAVPFIDTSKIRRGLQKGYAKRAMDLHQEMSNARYTFEQSDVESINTVW